MLNACPARRPFVKEGNIEFLVTVHMTQSFGLAWLAILEVGPSFIGQVLATCNPDPALPAPTAHAHHDIAQHVRLLNACILALSGAFEIIFIFHNDRVSCVICTSTRLAHYREPQSPLPLHFMHASPLLSHSGPSSLKWTKPLCRSIGIGFCNGCSPPTCCSPGRPPARRPSATWFADMPYTSRINLTRFGGLDRVDANDATPSKWA